MAKNKANPLEELSYGKPVRQHVREFAAVFALIFVIIATVKLYRGTGDIRVATFWTGLGVTFYALGISVPQLLHPLWKWWMSLAHMLGFVMTNVILSVLWVGLMVPLSLLLKVIGKRVMDTEVRKEAATYWDVREPSDEDFVRMERQF